LPSIAVGIPGISGGGGQGQQQGYTWHNVDTHLKQTENKELIKELFPDSQAVSDPQDYPYLASISNQLESSHPLQAQARTRGWKLGMLQCSL
jgi:hypothetical protein